MLHYVDFKYGNEINDENEDEEILGSDDEEQEDPRDYRKGYSIICAL